MKIFIMKWLKWIILACLCMSYACGTKSTVSTDVVGILFLDATQPIEKQGKLLATATNDTYIFGLDAAWVYFMRADAEHSYAGEHNFTSLVFGATEGQQAVSAKGTIAYANTADNPMIKAYPIHQDEIELYINLAEFEEVKIEQDNMFTGTTYPCQIQFEPQPPAKTLRITYLDAQGQVLNTKEYEEGELEDMRVYPVDTNVNCIQIDTLNSAQEVVRTSMVTKEESSAIVTVGEEQLILHSYQLYYGWE